MADPLGIIGVIAVAGQILSLTVKLGLDWKDAPEDAKSFLNEIQTLKTVLSETHTNIIINEDFKAAFEGRRSALLQELGNPTQPTSTFSLVETCKQQLDALLSDLKKRTEGHRLGWERLRGAFINKKTKETVEDLHRHCQTLNSLISLDALSLGLETHKEVKHARQEQQDWQNEQRSKDILDWLSESDHVAQQSDFLRRRQAGTGQWLLESHEYQKWVATPQTTLFCPGIPGAGKTMLTSIVVDDLQNRFRDDGSVSIAYLYCNFRRQTEQTVENLLSSILRQLTQNQPSLPGCVQALRSASGRQKPTLKQLSSTLQALVQALPRIFIVIDALDECQLVDGSRAQFLDEIFALQSGSNVNLFATSRFIKGITNRFSGVRSLEIRAHEEDVRRYLLGSIPQLPACVAKNPQLQEEIMTKIVEAVDGMFLLAKLHLNSLKGKRSPKTIRAALGALHTGSGAYDKAYDDAMERIAGQLEDQEELARQVLMWITCAMRPLKTIELQEALAVELGESELDPDNVPEIEDILSVCAGLVTVDDESNIIRLVHYTTQEYFSRTSDKWFPGAHCNITETCITYLSLDMFNSNISDIADDTYERLRANFVLDYAFEYWVNHASMPESEPCNQMVSNLISRRCSTTEDQEDDEDRLERLDSDLVDALLFFGRCELGRASATGRTRHVQYLLERGAFPNAMDRYRSSPLSCAVACGQIGSVRALLEWDAIDVNFRDSEGRTPLFLALKSGEREIIGMLLRARAIDTTVVSDSEETLLHAAATGGLEDIFKMFLDMDVDESRLNAQDAHGETPLHLAAENGHVAVVRMILDSDSISIHAKDFGEQTPLHFAAQTGHVAVIQMLLDFDLTTISARDQWGNTAFSLAAERGHEDAIRAILDFDSAAIMTADDSGETPLHKAAISGHEAVIRLLYDLDATTINARTRRGETPLHMGAQSGVEAVVQTLLSLNGIELDARDNGGSTTIHDAALSGNIQVLQLLLNTSNSTANIEDNEGRTPIWKAVERGHAKAVQYLLSVEGVNTDRTDSRGFTLLHCAVEAGHRTVVKTLLASGRFIVNQVSKAGETPLWLAASRCQSMIVHALLRVDGVSQSLNAKDSKGRTALSVAVERDYKYVVFLLERAHKKFGVKHDGS